MRNGDGEHGKDKGFDDQVPAALLASAETTAVLSLAVVREVWCQEKGQNKKRGRVVARPPGGLLRCLCHRQTLKA